MAANVPIQCPAEGCTHTANLRLDPGPGQAIPVIEALVELRTEHPDHSGTSWKYQRQDKPVT